MERTAKKHPCLIGGFFVITLKAVKNIFVSGLLALSISACQHSTPKSSMGSAQQPQNIESDYFGCYKVTRAESDIDNQAMNDLKKSTAKICIVNTPDSRSGPITIEFKTKTNALMNTIGFETAEAQRCPGCYAFTGSQEGTASISRTMAANLYNFTANLQSYGGQIRFNMITQPTNDNAAQVVAECGGLAGIPCKAGQICVGAHHDTKGHCEDNVGISKGQSCGGGITGALKCKTGLTCKGAHDNIPGTCQ